MNCKDCQGRIYVKEIRKYQCHRRNFTFRPDTPLKPIDDNCFIKIESPPQLPDQVSDGHGRGPNPPMAGEEVTKVQVAPRPSYSIESQTWEEYTIEP